MAVSSPVRRPPHIAVLVFEGVRGLDVAGPLEVFDVAGGLGSAYSVAFYSTTEATAVRCASGLTLHTAPVSALASEVIDILFVPGSESVVADGAPWHLVRTVRSHAARARRVASIGTGSFALAAAGVLDGRRATTHWRHLDSFAVRHPSVIVDRESVFVQDGPFITGAGITAGIDLALAMVESDFGPAVARRVARWMVVFLQRPGGQAQFSVWAESALPVSGGLREIVDSVIADPGADHSLAAMAERAAVSERHLVRVFREQVGMTPARFVEQARLEAAKVLLATGDQSQDAVARRTGLGTSDTLRRTFRRNLGISPGMYRNRFRTTGISQ